jgi:predicted heme/steroid binding protein
LKTFTLDELAQYNGKGGARAYFAYQGKVYDVTDSPSFQDGEHEGMHNAGADLTSGMDDAPHGDEALEGFPVVGELA